VSYADDGRRRHFAGATVLLAVVASGWAGAPAGSPSAEAGKTIVEAMNPMAALGIVGGEDVRPVAEEATARLERAIAALAPA
jgi:predicted dinucleotide-binding enzyme